MINKYNLALVALLLAAAPSPGIIVHDPVNSGVLVSTKVSTLAYWAKQIAAVEQQILLQINTLVGLKNLINLQDKLMLEIGNWRKVMDLANTIKSQTRSLTHWKENFRFRWDEFAHINIGEPTADFSDTSIYKPIAKTDAFGVEIAYDKEYFKRFKAVEGVYAGSKKLLSKTSDEEDRVLDDINRLANDLSRAPDQATVAKYAGQIEALKASLASLATKKQEALIALQREHILKQSMMEKEAAGLRQQQEQEACASMQKIKDRPSVGSSLR